MLERRIPEWLRHAPAPSVRGFAALSGWEAVTRGMLISVYPVAMYQAVGDAARVSSLYFAIGFASLVAGLLVPFLTRLVPRRWIYALGTLGYVAGCGVAMVGSPGAIIGALALHSIATVTTFVCLNAYVLDYIERVQLGRCETLRLFYSAAGWTVGPVLGVLLWGWWAPAPFVVSGLSACALLVTFLWLRLGNGKLIVRARRAPPNPLAFVGRFAAQPRLVAGWLFAVIRSCGWWAYIVYLPIFAVQNGYGDRVGGILLSSTNAALFAAPLMLRWMQAHSIRHAVRTGFAACGLLFLAASLGGIAPGPAIAALALASLFLILLDISGGLPFLMAVKPSERTEMSAIYSSYRDVSGIATPGLAWLVLLIAPLPGIFALTGTLCLGAWALARRLHPRLGASRLAPVAPLVPAPPLGAGQAGTLAG